MIIHRKIKDRVLETLKKLKIPGTRFIDRTCNKRYRSLQDCFFTSYGIVFDKGDQRFYFSAKRTDGLDCYCSYLEDLTYLIVLEEIEIVE